MTMTIQENRHDDAVNVAPHLHTVIFEDDKIRVLKVIVKPGETAAMHWHPRNINYVISGGTLHFDKPDGSSVDIGLNDGQITSAPAEGSHAVENVGDKTVETIQVELKNE
jgi:mannose-6-phosphate isomerase-like protein (cupin superfamily)